MGMNSTFQSFVHSEVKTAKGFRLIEAYLTYKNFTARQSAKYSDYEIIEEAVRKDRPNSTPFTAEQDFTNNSSFEEMPEKWMDMKSQEVATKVSLVSDSSPLNRKRQKTYQTLSHFTPKGKHLDSRF